MKAVDDRGRPVVLPRPPQRMVSLVPSITETLWALGAGERVAAVTRYCTDPPAARTAPRVGGTKNPDIEAIVALAPDLVLMSEEENRRDDFERLEERGIPVFVSFPRTVDDIRDWVRRLGEVTACGGAAACLEGEIEKALADVRAAAAHVEEPTDIFCPIWKKPWMTFNRDTYAGSVLEVCGGRNVFADAPVRYPRIDLAEALRRRPELVLLPDEPYPFGVGDLPDVRPLLRPEGSARRAQLVDGQALSWYGARTPRGLRTMSEAIFGGHT